MRLDSDIERDIGDELRCDPSVDATEIGVTVRDGVVRLSGFVHSYGQKNQAERDAERVAGVVGVADDIEVRVKIIDQQTDPDIVRDALRALRVELPFSCENIRAIVTEGWLTLEGALTWSFARARAECAIRNIRGIRGVTNSIAETPRVTPCKVRGKVEDALARSTELDASRIFVEPNGGQVILRGTVRSWVQPLEAGITSEHRC